MPGETHDDTQPEPPGATPDLFSAVVWFRDAAGLGWRARPDGIVEEMPPGKEPPHPV